MFYEVTIIKPNNKKKKIISAKELSENYWADFENKQKLDNVDSNNNKFAVKLLEKYGNNSKFGKENLSYVRPYLIDNKSREIVAVEFLNSFVKNKLNKTFNRNNIGELICVDELKKANLSIGGLFFYSKLLKKVVVELESNNYKII